MCKRRFDVAVIGAGPAGAIFASELAKLRPELTMLVIDGQSEQNKKVCGGLLAPDAQKVLASFDLTLPNAILADPQIFAVDTLDLSSGQRQVYQRHYLNMNRYLFDRWLTARIPSHVTVLSAHCDDIREEDGGYIVTVEGTVYRADSIVGADGANSTVRKTLIGAAPKQYTAIQEWYRMNSDELPHYSCIFDRTTSDSCSWTICKDGYWIFGGAFEKHGCRDAFAAQKLHLQQTLGCTFGEPIRREACLLTSPRHWRDFLCGRPGVYLIGEAGGFISASSFEGISAAMLCGRYLAQAFAAGRIKSDIWRRYCRLTLPLRLKLWSKTVKRALLCSPFFRYWIMKSGLQSIKTEPNRSIFTQLPPVC